MTKPTGRPPGHPPVPLWEHPFRLVLAFSDALQRRHGMTTQKAHLFATSIFFAEKAELIPVADLSKKMRRVFEQQGGIPVAYDLPASGNPDSMKIKERMQAVDTLAKMDRRYRKGINAAYRLEMEMLMTLVAFETGGSEMRERMINALIAKLTSFSGTDPQVKELTDLLR